ncbi:30S ribosomal protein S19e [Candidatus Woesearchaeota archaeon]|nr:30S ribosomal protein S19e [Candidatus Woesearchaeota archaeon]
MSKIFTVEANEFIHKLSEELKNVKEIQAPEWSKYCRTGVHKERPPEQDDWWHIRAAAILRSVFRLGPIGTEKLRTKYGGRKNRGVKPEHHKKGSGSVIRKILQQLETAKLIKQAEVGTHKGRVVTKEGKELLNKVVGVKE